MGTRLFALLIAASLLGGCGGEDAATAGAHQGEDGLPRPGAANGSVTGMPNPGSARAPRQADPALPASPEAFATIAPAEAPLDAPGGLEAGLDTAATTQQAQAVLRDYYAAINAGDIASAYALWADQGRGSGQSLQQFGDGFAATEGVSVQLGTARVLAGPGGARHVEIPATVDDRLADGGVRRHAGTYTLRLDTVDASTQEQRWRLVSADLREILP